MSDWLIKFLGVRMEHADKIVKAALSFRGGFPLGWVILLSLCLGALSLFVYLRSPVPVSRGRKIVMLALRLAFVTLLAILLLRPLLELTIEGNVRGSLLLLIDSSASMQIKDPRLAEADQKRVAIARNLLDPAKGLNQSLPRPRPGELDLDRLQLVKTLLKNPKLDLLPRLEKSFDLQPYAFAQNLMEIPLPSNPTNLSSSTVGEKFGWVDRLEASGPVTALGDSLRELGNRKRGQQLSGVLVITDGANNSGSLPQEVATRFRANGLPLYIYGVGITSPRDIIVENIFAQEITFLKDELPVTVRVRGQSMAGQKATLVLNLGKQKVAEREITFVSDAEQSVNLSFTPQQKGDFDLEALVIPRPDETVKENNSRAQRLRVIDSQIHVLMIEQTPRWEFRYLQAMLLRDRRVDLKCLLVEADPAVATSESPYLDRFPSGKEDLFKYDLIIFGDVDPKIFSNPQMEMVHDFVSKFGGALIMVAGKRFTPGAYRRTPLEKALPVEFEGSFEGLTENNADRPMQLELTAAGRNSFMLRVSDKAEESAAIWQHFPPIFWAAKVSRAKPAAEVLVVDPDPLKASRFGKMPVLAMQQYGVGHVLYVGTDNLWRWRKNSGDSYYTMLWAQMIQRMALQKLLGGSRRTQLSSNKQNYSAGERVSVYARLYTTGFEPMTERSIKSFFSLKSATQIRSEVQLRALPEQPGLYRGEFVAPQPGAYGFRVDHDPETQLDFNVVEAKFELGETAMNEAGLNELAKASGGEFFREEDLYRLPEALTRKSQRVQSLAEVELWASPPYFVLLVLLASLEWILRKRAFLK